MPSRLECARLCRYTYDSDKGDLGHWRKRGEWKQAEVRFCYMQHAETGEYLLAIRGSDNTSNWRDDAAMLADSGTLRKFREATEGALAYFEENYGRCSFATGHSLGGKLLEFLPERIRCTAFNAFFNENRPNISSVRVYGDIAASTFLAGKSHTDHWIGSPAGITAHIDPFRGAEKHSIETVVSILSAPGKSFLDDTIEEIVRAPFAGAGFFLPASVRRPVEDTAAVVARVALAPVVEPVKAIGKIFGFRF